MMNLEALRAFYTVGITGSISRASRILHLSQPAVSQQIQNLEREMEIILLDRSSQGVVLTSHGKIFHQYAKHVLDLTKNVENELRAIGSEEKTSIRIGACPLIAEHILPCSLYRFKEQNPDVQVITNIVNSDEIVEVLLEGIVHAGLIQGRLQHPDLVVKEIISTPYVLVTANHRNDVNRNRLGSDDLYFLPLVLPERGCCSRKLLEEALMHEEINPLELYTIMELSSFEAVKNLVVSGEGMAFLPYPMVRKELQDGKVRSIEVSGISPTWYASMVYPAKEKNPPALGRILQYFLSRERVFC